ncbi:SRPBCC domain-containing protein [Actinoplanes utahensis]|uniref:Transcriptional regulator n=1 Tax=Actinoplanes utahensis TaxID=1869 RepID=A0A0A6X536_ACTUT|nr:SRPBCC domain-containing protein [Actinoplanes utahensis]KHD75222.1 transcriptional regulator [Actinoplanes utahensis]GIF28395.1 transcriptional regulator [Actinoplanes utahensis]
MSDTQVFRIWIKASADRIWTAITDPEWTAKYGYAAPQFYELQKGGRFHSTATEEMKAYSEANGFPLPEVILDGEVLESEPPRRLVQTWRMLMDPTTAAEPFTTLTYDIEESGPGVCRVTITHETPGAPATAAMIRGNTDAGAEGGGGWAWVLSDLKSLLETGKVLASA